MSSKIAMELAEAAYELLGVNRGMRGWFSGEKIDTQNKLAAAFDQRLANVQRAANTAGPTIDELSESLMNLRRLYGEPGEHGSPIPLNHNLHWAIVTKMVRLRGCICPEHRSPHIDDSGSAWWAHTPQCGLPPSPADGGPAPIEGETAG